MFLKNALEPARAGPGLGRGRAGPGPGRAGPGQKLEMSIFHIFRFLGSKMETQILKLNMLFGSIWTHLA